MPNKARDLQEMPDTDLDFLAKAARNVMYSFPHVIEKMPPALIEASKAAIDTGRAARRLVDRY